MYNYVIRTSNTKLTHLFLLARMTTYILDDAEQIQHTPNVYDHIKKPATWYWWVLINNDYVEDVSITILSELHKPIVHQVRGDLLLPRGKFTVSDKTITKDIISMISDSTRLKRMPSYSTRKPFNHATDQTENKSQENGSEDTSQLKHPFRKH